MLEDVAPGEEAYLRANTGCWAGPPRERTMLLRTVEPASARTEALLLGGVDLAADFPAAELRSLASKPGVRLTQFPGGRQIALRVDPAFAPFSQPQVRQALAHALPYEDISQQVYGPDQARPVAALQDHRAARALLREGGYGSGFRFSLCLPRDNPDLDAAAQAIQLDLMRLNLKVVIERMDPALFAREQASRHLPVYLEERRPMRPAFSVQELDPQPEVEVFVLALPHCHFAARANVAGFVRRPDGRPRYAELRKT